MDFLTSLEALKKLEEKQKKNYSIISNLRLSVFLCGAALWIYLGSRDMNMINGAIIFISLILFVILILRHNAIQSALARTSCRIQITNEYLDRMSTNWVKFKDAGEEFVNDTHHYTSDLDLFGQKSLFQWINIANTFSGRVALKDVLEKGELDERAIKEKQKANRELAEKFDFLLELQCEGKLVPGLITSPQELLDFAEGGGHWGLSGFKKLVVNLLPIFTAFSILLAAVTNLINFAIPIILVLLQLTITGIMYRKIAVKLIGVDRFQENIQGFENLIKLMEKQNFENDLLKQIKGELSSKGIKASTGLKKLEKLTSFVDVRSNAIMYILLNGVLLWDIHCILYLDKWKKTFGIELRNWLEAIGKIEAMGSLAIISKIRPKWCFPNFENEGQVLKGLELGHPLISEEKRICNDINIENNVLIITGSNLSGKTTLMRTVGINLVLAYAGAPVCGKEMSCSCMKIFTSMRIKDDISAGISTFYAELLRVKMIIEYSKIGKPMIFLIDEIFRGTNSLDRITGARSVLNNLSKEWVAGLITTHDFELCNLETKDSTKVQNFHFSENYEKNEIHFDYNMKRGRCSTTNAKYLMRLVGIELIE